MSEFVRTTPGRNPDDADAHGVDLVIDDAPPVRLLIRGRLPNVLEHAGRIWVRTEETHDGSGGPPIAVFRPEP